MAEDEEFPDFEDRVATVLQTEPREYATTTLRRPMQVHWTDSAGSHTVELDGRLIAGSASGSGLVIADPAVSRIHAELELRDDGAWLRDLGSRNGTFIEGVQIRVGRVPDRGSIRLGSTVLKVQLSAAPKAVELWPGNQFGPLLGQSVVMRELFARLSKVAATDSTVLIQGETGTGKELVAQAIHEASPRHRQPFVVVDCAALPEALLEAELFGHTKGAFTGAAAARVGAIEAAEHGTVFLDEVGEMPLALQPKLLRVLESRTIRRIGETAHRKIDVRIISATHRDVRAMVNDGTFREDLYFRLAVIPVTIPPLRDRPEDLLLLIRRFAPPSANIAELVAESLKRPWRGNVRALRNFVERAVALGTEEAISMQTTGELAAASPTEDVDDVLLASLERPLREARVTWMDALERAYVRRLMDRHGGAVARAAEAAGVDRTHLYRLIRKHIT
jgi:transcriptional regulator with GAF, ATPase, and Fis domain